MDSIAVSRRNHNNKRGNKENAQPAYGSKTFLKRDVSKAATLAPLHLKNNGKEETLAKDGTQKVKPRKGDVRVISGEALKKTEQKGGKVGTAVDAKKRQTFSQAFLTEQAVRQRKIVAEAPKPSAAVPLPKSAPGMYKGKIIQSKIGSIWKSNAAVGGTDPNPLTKPSAPKAESQKVGNLTKVRSKSVADLPGRGMQKPKPTRSNSVSDGPPPVSRRPVTGRPMTGSRSALPPARTVRTTVAGPSSRNTATVPTKAAGTQSNKPKRPTVTDKKVNKPPVSSTISQYRANMETAEERRAKLAEWLASKGKTLKRPAMTAAPPKTKTAVKPEVHLQSEPQPQSHVEAQPAAPRDPEPQAEPTHRPGSPAAQPEDNQRAEDTTHSSPPLIMNTTLELLDNSDMDLPEPEAKMNDIVVNLCDALEAMATPSRCEDEPPQTKDERTDVDMEDSTPRDEYRDDLEKEMPEECISEPEDQDVKSEVEENDDQKVENICAKEAETDEEEEEEEEEDEEEEEEGKGMIDTTPKMEEASVVKYSVRTTPYLQSMKKTIEGEVVGCGSRRKSSIKDLKFLTPVRRSSRIQRKSSRLPGMLVDHDTCVSSLAELVKLDDEANAYIYRRNPALLEDLPDQPKDL